ncbi:MAG: phosphatase PAP2 family protein [Ignavibacteriales bacterium]|nr:phosphatase PAP2 family protein [Ignavibacteriales bacterium]
MRRANWAVLACFVTAVSAQARQADFDTRLFLSINSKQDPSSTGFVEVLDLSSLPSFAATPVGFLAVGILTDNNHTTQAGILTAASQLSAFGVTFLLKEAIARPRPFETLSSVKTKHLWSAGGYSFPSGHTSQAFAIATALSLHYRKPAISIPLFFWASAIGYGRIYLGVHYPSDVLGGMVIGSAAGLLVWSLRGEFQELSKRIVPLDPAVQESGGFVRLFHLTVSIR